MAPGACAIAVVSGGSAARNETCCAHDVQHAELLQRVAAERARLRAGAGLPRPQHYRRPAERPFTAAERGTVTILLGGLTSVHDRLITAVFDTCGYRSHSS